MVWMGGGWWIGGEFGGGFGGGVDLVVLIECSRREGGREVSHRTKEGKVLLPSLRSEIAWPWIAWICGLVDTGGIAHWLVLLTAFTGYWN